MKERINYLELKIKQFDGERCKRKVIISKVPNVTNKDFHPGKAVKHIGSLVGVQIEENDIDSVFIRRPKSNARNPDTLIVNFTNLQIKQKLMAAKKNLEKPN